VARVCDHEGVELSDQAQTTESRRDRGGGGARGGFEPRARLGHHDGALVDSASPDVRRHGGDMLSETVRQNDYLAVVDARGSAGERSRIYSFGDLSFDVSCGMRGTSVEWCLGFAKALRDTASLPGAGDFASPMKEIADLLDSPTAAPTTAAAATASTTGEGAAAVSASVAAASDIKPAAVQQDPATRALSATADFGRLTTETVDLSVANTRTPCTVAGQAALCVRSREGVIIITDVISGRSCPDRVFVGATLSDSVAFGFRWQFEASTNALTGARLSIGSGERLQVAVIPGPKGPSNSPDCFVTWSGFRPWIFAGGSR